MNRATINLMIDALAALFLVAMIATGYVLWFALPPGTNRTHELWGMLRHTWGMLHAAASLGLLILVTIHLALHWKWLVTNLCKRCRLGAWQQAHPVAASVGAVAIIVLPLSLFGTLTLLQVRTMATPVHPNSQASPPMGTNEGHGNAVGVLRDGARRVLAFRCGSCHGVERRAGGVRADTPESLLMDQRGVRWVTPGDVARSPLFGVISAASRGSGRGSHVVPDEDLQSLQAWVAEEPAR